MAWIEPKINWNAFSRFDIEDYNRIRNNLLYLHERCLVLIGYIDFENLGEDLQVELDEDKDWDVNIFNSIENNLHTISDKVIKKDIGLKKTFYNNGLFPDYSELNRIESITLQNKNALDNLESGLRRIPFKLGRFKARL